MGPPALAASALGDDPSSKSLSTRPENLFEGGGRLRGTGRAGRLARRSLDNGPTLQVEAPQPDPALGIAGADETMPLRGYLWAGRRRVGASVAVVAGACALNNGQRGVPACLRVEHCDRNRVAEVKVDPRDIAGGVSGVGGA
jgi:hypothetical protein